MKPEIKARLEAHRNRILASGEALKRSRVLPTPNNIVAAGPYKQPTGVQRPPCIYLKQASEPPRYASCETCNSGVQLRIFDCEKFGDCTIAKTCTGLACCATCSSRRSVPPFTGPITRNLIYYIWPISGNGIWQRNLEQIRARLDLFNGKRIAVVATSERADSFQKVSRDLSALGFESIEIPNNPDLREVAGFRPLFDAIQSTDVNEVSFFAHAKGVTRPVNDGTTVHRWTDLMYETCLDYWPLVESLLSQYPLAGSFKKLGYHFTSSMSAWHYTGTYYWLRHCGVFDRPWQNIDQGWWGTESWPGLHFAADEGGCIFHEGAAIDLYDFSYFNDTVMPLYRQWQRDHAHERTRSLA